MSTNNHQNSGCGFGEKLVSYLYDEISGLEKEKFDIHLDDCKSCVEEYSSFGIVRSSLGEWRDFEFAPLETPQINLSTFEPVAVAESTGRGSWLKLIQSFFITTPRWVTTVSFATVLAVILGIGIAGLNNSYSPDVSEGKRGTDQVETEVTEQIKPINKTVESANNDPTYDETIVPKPELLKGTPPNDSGFPKSAATKEKRRTDNSLTAKEPKVKTTNRPNETATANKNRTVDKNLIPGEIPKLTNFPVEEDNSLRLADLFDEIGSR